MYNVAPIDTCHFPNCWAPPISASKVLDVPDPDVLAEEFPEKLPCAAYPSDHLSLVADVLVP